METFFLSVTTSTFYAKNIVERSVSTTELINGILIVVSNDGNFLMEK